MLASDRRARVLAVLAVGAFLLAQDAPGAEPIDYGRQVKPILKQRCYACHGALKRQANLRLDTGQAIRRGGDGGPAIEPGQGDESLLLDRVRETDAALRMPPEGAPLSAEQVAVLQAWIEQGAISPADEPPETDPRKHWAFLPPVRPTVPALHDSSWVRDPIDAFLAEEHERRGLTPLPPAEPHVLLRRLYLDLIGLPPTRAQLHEFLADPSDASYERIVDRLLASPQYGERWGRHWMDVWRYSDWYGRRAVPDVLNSYAQIWRWRDWIVRSLNGDKGYDRMVREMLAADELAPVDDSSVVATGFLVRNFYRWNYNIWMKDNVEHTGKAFLGLTFNCAHCHDHKYDPIKHEDYFALRAVFEPLEIRHDRVAGEPDPGPYPKYDYGKAYGPITSGLVRVFDEKLDAKTFLYTRGESRNVVPDRPPIPPGMPSFLGGASFEVKPIDLPAESSYPGLRAFIRTDEMRARDTAVAKAGADLAKSLPLAHAAERALADREAKLAPDNPRAFADPFMSILAFPEPAPVASELQAARTALETARTAVAIEEAGRNAAMAERDAFQARIAADDAKQVSASGDIEARRRAASKAERRAAAARAEIDVARGKSAVAAAEGKPKAELTAASQTLTAARKARDAARTAIANDSTAYTPLSPVYPTRSTGRRTALANWITNRANPLAARVAVNHLWRWHFGKPLVATTSDFGRNGSPPTHPKLLDWLAVELMEPTAPGAQPWSMKALHRRFVTSASYRMRSHQAGASEADRNRGIDRENQWYWHFPASRMEAEEVRDGLLHVAGALDSTLGGPDIDFAQGLTSARRSLYFTHHGEARMTFLELFDAPDACDAYKRSTSVVPQQALALVNNEWLLTLSRTLANRVWNESEPSAGSEPSRVETFIIASFEQILTRLPTARERELAGVFLAKQAALLARLSDPSGSATNSKEDPEARARRDLVHALFSHNDFVTIH